MGLGMRGRYILSAAMPLILIFVITSILIFSLTFIVSMSSSIDRMIQLIGSGTLQSSVSPEGIDFPKNTIVESVRTGEGIVNGENGKSIVYLKGVDNSYFQGERGKAIKSENILLSEREILLSTDLASDLSLEEGSRLTLLIYDSDKDRARPVLFTVKGIFDSGYSQLDRYLAFVPRETLTSSDSYEILLSKSENPYSVRESLLFQGYPTTTYRELYYSLYSNVQASIQILYFIFASVALLSAFFSIDIAHVYVSRDIKDIVGMRIMGVGKKRVIGIYLIITVSSLAVASILGALFGVLISFVSPYIVQWINSINDTLLDYYISGFSITVPYLRMLLVIFLMALTSFISVFISLSHLFKRDESLLVNSQESW